VPELLNKVNQEIVNPLILLLIGAGVAVFLFGVYEFLAGWDSEEKRRDGQRHMLWGLIGLFIMTAFFGIMNIICKTLGAC